MRFKFLFALSAKILLFVGLAMAAPLVISLYLGEKDSAAIAIAMAVTVLPAALVMIVVKIPPDDLTHREGIMIACLVWLLTCLFGALPFFFAKMVGPMTPENFINCLFESVSGFTTTGSSVLGGKFSIEKVGTGLLFWRSLTHWLGGMGIIVLAIAILPMLGVGGMQLFKAEAAAHLHEKLRPRIRECAITLWTIYVVLTVIGIVMFMGGGMSLFEAFCHTAAALASGGFSTRDASIGAFHSQYIEIVAMGIMFAGTVSFSVHYAAWSRSLKAYWQDSQFRYYVAFLASGSILVSLCLYVNGTYGSLAESFRQGTFNSVSIMTTTGFATVDCNNWPSFAQLAMVLFMFMGGCVGSTAGAIKVARVVLLFKFAHREIIRLIHPTVFASVKLGGKVVHRNVLESVAAFFGFYMLFYVLSVLVVSFAGLTFSEAVSGVATTIGGVGPGFGRIGTMGNFYDIPILAKCVFIMDMLLGRLEIFTLIAIMAPTFWKK